MRRKESRNDLPLPVAPIPAIPTFSKELKVVEVVDRLDRWYGELDHWLHIWRKRNATFLRRLPKIEEQIRLLLQRADEYLPEGVHISHGFEKRSSLAQYHELLARALGAANDWEKDGEAVKEFKRAMSLAPEVADYWYSYVRHLVLRDSIGEALDEINAVELRLIQTEKESIAQQIVNWALAYPEIGFGIRADIIKHCIALVSRVGTGLLVRGCPLPHAPANKWQRTEILRVLWAGMQCSVPVDELCKREGIDEATYYRWRKRYLPPEWGEAPALV
jgi:transposase